VTEPTFTSLSGSYLSVNTSGVLSLSLGMNWYVIKQVDLQGLWQKEAATMKIGGEAGGLPLS